MTTCGQCGTPLPGETTPENGPEPVCDICAAALVAGASHLLGCCPQHGDVTHKWYVDPMTAEPVCMGATPPPPVLDMHLNLAGGATFVEPVPVHHVDLTRDAPTARLRDALDLEIIGARFLAKCLAPGTAPRG